MIATLTKDPAKASETTLNSYLKYPGGKRREVHHIQPFWEKHQHRRLVDLTVGSVAIPLALRPKSALLNDANPHVINLHQQVKRGLKVTIEMRYDEELYYEHRDWFNRLIDEDQEATPEAAQLLYYLNRSCFNGVMRFAQAGNFNVGFGSYKTVNYLQSFTPWKQAFRTWKFQCGDFSQVKLRPTDFVVADPPYDSPPKREQLTLPGLELTAIEGGGFTSYNAEDFSWAKQMHLVEFLKDHPGPVVLFNHATDRIVSLYHSYGYSLKPISGNRSVSCNGNRSPAKDVIAFKNMD